MLRLSDFKRNVCDDICDSSHLLIRIIVQTDSRVRGCMAKVSR